MLLKQNASSCISPNIGPPEQPKQEEDPKSDHSLDLEEHERILNDINYQQSTSSQGGNQFK
jgi:hypothetical protein